MSEDDPSIPKGFDPILVRQQKRILREGMEKVLAEQNAKRVQINQARIARIRHAVDNGPNSLELRKREKEGPSAEERRYNEDRARAERQEKGHLGRGGVPK